VRAATASEAARGATSGRERAYGPGPDLLAPRRLRLQVPDAAVKRARAADEAKWGKGTPQTDRSGGIGTGTGL
jgi:hypothetical protein